MSDRNPPKRAMSLMKHRKQQQNQLSRSMQRKRSRKESKQKEQSSSDQEEEDCQESQPRKRLREKLRAPGKETCSFAPQAQESMSNGHRRQQQQYTELSAVGHILSDQVHMYALEKPLSVGELRQLSAWDNAVETEIYHHNSCILENVRLVADSKRLLQKVESLRDDLVVLRTSSRRMREETKQLERELQQINEDSRTRQRASRFLAAVEKLGKACREHGSK